MMIAVLIWVGVVLGIGLLLVMALGPLIVEMDANHYERQHERRRAARETG